MTNKLRSVIEELKKLAYKNSTDLTKDIYRWLTFQYCSNAIEETSIQLLDALIEDQQEELEVYQKTHKTLLQHNHPDIDWSKGMIEEKIITINRLKQAREELSTL